MEEIVNQLFELYTLGIVMGFGLMMVFGCIASVIGFIAGKISNI